MPSARLHAQATGDAPVRLADQGKIDGEHIQI
jgi:hypothetical protein